MNLMRSINIYYIINFIIFSTISINFFTAGLPQHYHYLFLINFLIFFNFNFSDILINIYKIKYLLIFLIFIILYGLIRYLISGNYDYFSNLKFYAYNFFVVISFFLLLIKYNNLFKYVILGCISGIFLNILLIFYAAEINSFLYLNNYSSKYIRLDLLSKSKNTFGFYILFVNTLFFQYFNIYYKSFYQLFIKYLLFMFSFGLLISSVAIASILGLCILIILSFLSDMFYYKRIKLIFIPFLFTITLSVIIYLFIFYPSHIDNFFSILFNLGSNKDETFVGRGYDIVLSYPNYLFFGAGDIEVRKYFDWDIEIHSLFIHTLFSFGIIGSILMLFFFYETFKKNMLLAFIVYSTFSVYYLSHNPIFSTMFWLTLVFLNYSKILKK